MLQFNYLRMGYNPGGDNGHGQTQMRTIPFQAIDICQPCSESFFYLSLGYGVDSAFRSRFPGQQIAGYAEDGGDNEQQEKSHSR